MHNARKNVIFRSLKGGNLRLRKTPKRYAYGCVHVTIPFGGWKCEARFTIIMSWNDANSHEKGSGIGHKNANYVLRDYCQPELIVFKYVVKQAGISNHLVF